MNIAPECEVKNMGGLAGCHSFGETHAKRFADQHMVEGDSRKCLLYNYINAFINCKSWTSIHKMYVYSRPHIALNWYAIYIYIYKGILQAKNNTIYT